MKLYLLRVHLRAAGSLNFERKHDSRLSGVGLYSQVKAHRRKLEARHKHARAAHKSGVRLNEGVDHAGERRDRDVLRAITLRENFQSEREVDIRRAEEKASHTTYKDRTTKSGRCVFTQLCELGSEVRALCPGYSHRLRKRCRKKRSSETCLNKRSSENCLNKLGLRHRVLATSSKNCFTKHLSFAIV